MHLERRTSLHVANVFYIAFKWSGGALVFKTAKYKAIMDHDNQSSGIFNRVMILLLSKQLPKGKK